MPFNRFLADLATPETRCHIKTSLIPLIAVDSYVVLRHPSYGEFSPNGQLFTLSSFFKIALVDQKLGLLTSTKKLLYCINFAKISDWDTFWADFSQHRDP
jgi:hypothetical protein